ncbi:isochorismatase family protein [Acinetobacter sp. C26M]|uniref:isochorismatase family protein n=1 Tax=unclassified Acinetobacter TaxID=196816 RepID=UPI002036773F|nr:MULTISPECIES: isochorismatase family protein [unclassified Acinetobacter]USA44980.1 isochorismatase family protein [Acinetobacter sp. C26M]USA48483.1 isochorismatase family protein [Acinetobacter sp. C26G]
MQNAFVSGAEAVPASKQLIASIRILLTKARSAHAPVIFLQNDGEIGTLDEPYQIGWELFFSPQLNEVIIRKSEDNGFKGTSLQQILDDHNVKSLAICGVLSEMCVAATARAALARDYAVWLPHDAHATYDVPAGPGSESVPAALAARVAEWSLGDEIMICASVDEIVFMKQEKDSSKLNNFII